MWVEEKTGPDFPRSKKLTKLRDEAIDQLTRMGHKRTYGPGQLIFLTGDPGDCVYLIVSGQVDISISSIDGRRLQLVTLSAGALFGELAVLDGCPRSADAAAVSNVVLLEVGRAAFHQAMATVPALADHVLKTLCARMRHINHARERPALLPARGAIASRLLSLAAEQQKSTIRIKQQDLAQQVGVSREYVCQILNAWKRRGWIDTAHGAVSLRHPEQLAELSA